MYCFLMQGAMEEKERGTKRWANRSEWGVSPFSLPGAFGKKMREGRSGSSIEKILQPEEKLVKTKNYALSGRRKVRGRGKKNWKHHAGLLTY